MPVHTDSLTSLWLNNNLGSEGRERRTVVEVFNGQYQSARRERKPCLPHGPYVVDAARDGSYVAHCLACGLAGPKGEDALQVKLAFDQRWH